MPRGQRRTAIEKLQDEIRLAEKRRSQGMDAAAKEKKEIVRLENEINKSYAREITKACRAKGYPLEKVLLLIKDQPDYDPAAEAPAVPASAEEKPPAAKKGGRKPAGKRTAKAKAEAVNATESADAGEETSSTDA